MRVTYGINIDEDPEDYLTIAEEVMTIFSEAFAPGRYLVETFPILRFVPSWMPGAGFKRSGKVWTKVVEKLVVIPWKTTMKAMVRTLNICEGCQSTIG